MAVDSFVSVSVRLASAIAPCLSSVLNDLHAETLIGFELKDELVNGNETNAKKATKLVTELERSLKSDCNPEELLETICSVLKKQKESQLTQIADTLRTGSSHQQLLLIIAKLLSLVSPSIIIVKILLFL